MKFKSVDNKWLVVLDTVRLTDPTDNVIFSLEQEFMKAGLKAFVTRALSSSKDQLRIIQKYLQRKGLDSKYPETAFCQDLHARFKWQDKDVYQWQPGWSALLNSGVIINPPMPAECLMDYFRNGENKKGDIIGATPHLKGMCFDIGGGGDGIANELAVVQKAKAAGMKGIRGYLAEHANNCVHVDVE